MADKEDDLSAVFGSENGDDISVSNSSTTSSKRRGLGLLSRTPKLHKPHLRNPFHRHQHQQNTSDNDDDSESIGPTAHNRISFDPRRVVESVSKTMNIGHDKTKIEISEIEKLAQKRGANTEVERFAVVPSYAYPKTKFNREELRQEMNKPSSFFHDLRPPLSSSLSSPQRPMVGQVSLEILQCFGIPKAGVRTEASAFCILVCGQYAFKTDVMPHVANPMWLSKMRRACTFPLFEAYARVCVGVFGKVEGNARDVFIGRVVLDLSRLRPGSTYDVTLPLRQSNQVYARQKCGSVRFRFHLTWLDERAALLSYLPTNTAAPQFEPHDMVTVKCLDSKAFQNVTRTVHGHDCPGKFSMKLTKATMREFNFLRINILRYLRKQEIRDIRQWRYPVISFFIFSSWMHSVYVGSMKYLPGNLVTYAVLVLWKNYAIYVLDSKYDNGFVMPTWEEMMGSLLFGKAGACHIEPLEMERQDPQTCRTALSDFDEEGKDKDKISRAPTMQEIAQEFRDGVKRSGRRRALQGSTINTFTGTDAVDFLVFRGFAFNRDDAVELGKKLQHEGHVFEHIRRKQDFKDENVYYSFLNYDTSEYVFKTHRPWFKNVSHMIGFHKERMSSAEAHMEFPFASGIDHPRFTIKESLVIRSRESRNALARMESIDGDNDEDEDEDVVTQLGSNSGHMKEISGEASNSTMDGSLYPDHNVFDSALFTVQGDDESEFETESVADNVEVGVENSIEVKVLPKPPNQDMLFSKKAEKTIPEALENTKVQVHRVFGHLFHDKAYKLPSAPVKQSLLNEGKQDLPNDLPDSPRNKKHRFPHLGSKQNAQHGSKKKGNGGRKKEVSVVKLRKDEYDKLLHSAKFSTNNVITSKVAVIVQPLIELVQLFLSAIRALFNVLTWRDPFLTFWVATFLTVLVPILHMFPWRFVLGISGLVMVGPQNWILRLVRERENGGPIPDEFDVVKKRKKNGAHSIYDLERPFFFSSLAPDNRPIMEDQLDMRPEAIKEVAVPHSQLLYRRCYDWPPEPEYCRVWKSDPPTGDPVVQRLMDSSLHETNDGAIGDNSSHGVTRRRSYSGSSSHQGNLNQRARQMMTGSVARVKNIKKQIRLQSSKDI